MSPEPQHPLCDRLPLTPAELQSRLAFLGITREDRDNHAVIHAVIRDHVDEVIEEFYNHLGRFPDLARFLSDPDRLARLKATQREYLLTLGQHADQLSYAENRLRIGFAHERIGLEQKWYLGAYAKLFELIMRRMTARYGNDVRTLTSLTITLQKYLKLDQTFLVETYYQSAMARLEASLQELEQIRQYLEEHSRIDELTQAYNRNYVQEALQAELQRSRRFRHPFTLLFLDLDLFKQVNDRHGHACGDFVLKRSAALVRNAIRPADILGRYGGEEFAVGLVECDEVTAVRIAERVRETISKAVLLYEGQEISITVSIGVSTLKPDVEKFETLIAQADTALYQAKAAGRNRVEIYKDVMRET
jgi:diguanylate cyclase (GGDEF)-like protein